MRCKIPEISWHNRDPVLSVDIQPKCENLRDQKEGSETVYRLASAGSDSHVLIWYLQLTADNSDVVLEPLADLTRHQHAVNVVKWSPNGELLASGDDESVIFIWKQKTETDPPNLLETLSDQDKEVWLSLKVLRGHMEDIYDLSWAPNSQFLISGSVDNSAIMWDVQRGKAISILGDHKSFVQGVAWDPCNQYVATLCTDRYLRVFDVQSKRIVHRVNKGTFNMAEGHEYSNRSMRYFHDDTLQTYFRRLCFSPDGKFLFTPAGVADYEGCARPMHTSYAFSRYAFKQPALVIPCPDQYTVAITCCPLLFELRPYDEDKNPPVVPLPYRMIFAVATRSSVYFYDTQQHQPFAMISNIHYTHLTDISWSKDGRVVIVSSTDGFCSIIIFKNGELGEQYKEMHEVLSNLTAIDNSQTTSQVKKAKKQKEIENTSITKKMKSGVGEPLKENFLDAMSLGVKMQKERIDHEGEKCEKMDVDSEDDGIGNVSPQIPIKTASPPPKILLANIILDKEILSSDEKFQSPEKKRLSTTPITIRRHPRTPKSEVTSTTASLLISDKQEIDASPHHLQLIHTASNGTPTGAKISTNSAMKAATPIAVRSKPRSLVSRKSPVPPVTPSLNEEAMDTWPTKIPDSPPCQENIEDNQTKNVVGNEMKAEKREQLRDIEAPPSVQIAIEATEDIRLVYEDSMADTSATDNATLDSTTENKCLSNQVGTLTSRPVPSTPSSPPTPSTTVNPGHRTSVTTPNNKTPRRVEFKTISTPKSNKKIL